MSAIEAAPGLRATNNRRPFREAGALQMLDHAFLRQEFREARMRSTPCCIGETRWRGCGLFAAGDALLSTITRVRVRAE